MKVFISWSGPQSNHIAQALRDWLRDVIQNLTPWMSEVDINAGERWGERLWQELQDSQFGVVCLTAENLESPWLHYEAGALAKAVDRRVCPYLYEIKPIMVQGPLSHHQAKQVDKQGTKELLHSINAASLDLTQRGIRPEDFDRVFETWWPQLGVKLTAVPSSPASPPRRETREMLEEILEISRSLAREAASAKEERRAREVTSVNEERKKILLKKLAELERTVPPIDSDIGDNIVDVLKKRIEDRSAFPNLETFLKGKLPPK